MKFGMCNSRLELHVGLDGGPHDVPHDDGPIHRRTQKFPSISRPTSSATSEKREERDEKVIV